MLAAELRYLATKLPAALLLERRMKVGGRVRTIHPGSKEAAIEKFLGKDMTSVFRLVVRNRVWPSAWVLVEV